VAVGCEVEAIHAQHWRQAMIDYDSEKYHEFSKKLRNQLVSTLGEKISHEGLSLIIYEYEIFRAALQQGGERSQNPRNSSESENT
jgi:hypothetical protein